VYQALESAKDMHIEDSLVWTQCAFAAGTLFCHSFREAAASFARNSLSLNHQSCSPTPPDRLRSFFSLAIPKRAEAMLCSSQTNRCLKDLIIGSGMCEQRAFLEMNGNNHTKVLFDRVLAEKIREKWETLSKYGS